MRSLALSVLFVLGANLLSLPASAGDSRYLVPEQVRNAGRDVNVTKDLQSLIDQCSEAGGGTVVLPPGDYQIGTLLLKENTLLELSGGATLYGSHDINDYAEIGESGITALIGSTDCQNVGIVGQGTINGQGDAFWRGKKRPYTRPDRLILLYKSEDVRVRDVTIKNSPNWCVDIRECDRVWVDSVTIRNERKSPNSDGIDPVSSSNVFISNCDIDTGDDAICPKTRGERPLENLVVTNCVLRSDDSAIKLGTRSDADIRNVSFSNIVIKDTQYGIGLFCKDGGTFENIRFHGIQVETTRAKDPSRLNSRETYPIFIDVEKRNPKSKLGSVKRVVFSDISIDTMEGSCLFLGQPDSKLQDIVLSGVDFRLHHRNPSADNRKPRGTKSLQDKASNDCSTKPGSLIFAHVDGLNIQGVRYTDESDSRDHERQILWGRDLHDVSVRGVSTKMTTPNQSQSLLCFEASSGIEITSCHPGPSEAPFVEVDSVTKGSVVYGNNFTRAPNILRCNGDCDENQVRIRHNLLPLEDPQQVNQQASLLE